MSACAPVPPPSRADGRGRELSPILPRPTAPREDRGIARAPDRLELLDEHSLVELAREDVDAFAELYRRHVAGVHAFVVRRMGRGAADDVTSATFERALAKLHRFRWRDAGIRPWLYRLAANEIAQHHRRRNRHETDRAQATLNRFHQAVSPAADCADPDERDRLVAAIDRLRPRHQRAIGLRYLADLEPAEAAAAMGVSPGTFAVTVHRARKALQRILEEDQP